MAKKIFNELSIVTEHSISDFLLDEEASIPKGRLLTIGSLMIVLAVVLGVQDAFAGHRSHRSHSSHRSGAYHRSHVSHISHTSARHSSHSSHSSNFYYNSKTVTPPKSLPAAPASPNNFKIPQVMPDTIPSN